MNKTQKPTTDARAMTSLEKMLGLLDVFTAERPVWSSEDLIHHTGAPPSTCYRYLKALHSAGYLARVANKSYVLGPRILELDRVTRKTEPVYLAGSAVAERLTRETGFSSLLSILFSDAVMCVQQARGRDVPTGLFDRGQRRTLVAGASAKAILAYLPMHQLRTLYARHAAAIEAVGLGADWEAFKASLRRIRQAGHASSLGDYNPGIASVAAPIFNRDHEVLGSVALVASVAHTPAEVLARVAPQVMQAAHEISARIAAEAAVTALPARALG